MLLFEYENIIRVTYEKENNLIIHHWYDYNPDLKDGLIFEILDKIFETFLETNASRVLVNVSQTRGAFSPEVSKYIHQVQFPRLVNETNMKFVVTVTSKKDGSAKYAALWKDQLEMNHPVILHDVDTEAEARDWLKEIASMK